MTHSIRYVVFACLVSVVALSPQAIHRSLAAPVGRRYRLTDVAGNVLHPIIS